ncbi:MAG TPA: ferritin-like domain-containing protein [Kofleriaceae bacterium]|nr:ferritin-like domain-containing protein [Kofleriaceae bacterium]
MTRSRRGPWFWLAGTGESDIPFDMFDPPRAAEEARRAHKLATIYHRGQELAWGGREVLDELIAKHGPIQIAPDKQAALGRVFAIIMWGELAAWKISAQLADQLVPLEAKMAATSQAHDEARHFYVMYDYLTALGYVPRTIDRSSRAVLDLVLRTDSMLEKLIGMQLMVETLALTIFQLVREAKVEPVLADLLRYYERDEARHVGLGIQHLPELMRKATRLQTARAIWFQLKIAGWTLRGLKDLEPHLRVLGIPSRRVLMVGRNKMFTASEMLWQGMGTGRPMSRSKLEAAIDAVAEVMFPRDEVGPRLRDRLASARKVWRAGGLETEMVDLAG